MAVETATVIALIIGFAAFGQTVAGFGFSLLAVAPLGLVADPKDAVVVSSILLVVNSAMLAWGERANIQWPAVSTLLAGAVPGLPLGVLLLEVASVRVLRIALAAAILAAVAIMASGVRVSQQNRGIDLAAGFATGLLTTSLNANGPPTVLALQARRLDPQVFRPTTSAVLGLTSAVGAVLFAFAGRVTGDVGDVIVVAAPAMVVGWFVGTRVRHRIPNDAFRRLVTGLLLLAAGVTMVAALT